jgi:opacity protein-like surface antigen
MRRARVMLMAMLCVGMAAPAYADLTAFVGTTSTPVNRRTQGISVGVGLLIVGFEFEYAKTREDVKNQAPSMWTGMGNVLLQTPFEILRMQPYVTAGAGPYRERLGTHQQTFFGLNSGAGVKIGLAGPLRARLDYRVFRLGSGALESPTHRFYAGLNLKF